MTLSDLRTVPGHGRATSNQLVADPRPADAFSLVRLLTEEHATQHRVRMLAKGPQRLIGVVLLIALWELAALAGWIQAR
jgi:hypothetical protein